MTLSIVLPAYNESATIGGLVKDLKRALTANGDSFEIVVVDNGSTDNSKEVLGELAKNIPELKIVSVFPNRGLGNGILQGLKEARGEILGWMPGDGQVTAEDLVNVHRMICRGDYALCKGSRTRRNDAFFRLVQSRVFNTLFHFLFGVRSKDVNGTPKLFTRALYDRLDLASMDWFIDAELLIKAHKLKVSFHEISMAGQFRGGGASKVRIPTVFEFLSNMMKYQFGRYETKES